MIASSNMRRGLLQSVVARHCLLCAAASNLSAASHKRDTASAPRWPRGQRKVWVSKHNRVAHSVWNDFGMPRSEKYIQSKVRYDVTWITALCKCAERHAPVRLSPPRALARSLD